MIKHNLSEFIFDATQIGGVSVFIQFTLINQSDMLQQINSIQDVVTFIATIAAEVEDANPFKEFSSHRIYTPAEAAIRDKLMDRCFEVCAAQTLNFKSLMLVLFEEALNNPGANQIKSIINTHIYDTAN